MNPADYIGQKIDLDGFPRWQPFQCLDWARFWQQLIGGPNAMPTPYSGGAKDVWLYHDMNFYDAFSSGVPVLGDIIIWNGNYGGGYGHIAVVESANGSGFTSEDQNWSAPYVTRERHSYNGVLGWLRKKGGPVAQSLTDQVNDLNNQKSQLQAQLTTVANALTAERYSGIVLAYRAYLDREPDTEEVSAWLNAHPNEPISQISELIHAYSGKNGEKSGYPFTANSPSAIIDDLQTLINKYK